MKYGGGGIFIQVELYMRRGILISKIYMKFKRIAIRCVALIWFFFIFIVYYITFFNRSVSAKAKDILQAELDDYLTLRQELLEGKFKVW